MESSIPEYQILGKNYIIAKNWGHYDDMMKNDVMGAGTHATMMAYLSPYDLAFSANFDISGRGWYRSKEQVAGKYPYSGFLANKNWHLNEVMIQLD